eukprot:TRINITY_DN422_c7_g1_i2.p1 TRINITY_DN422_c7_g1~~TRINITY_DN422_c7_g1_i2.p1  ORF type:complete len:940 (+),score=228.28 TRINITY_DN422_c7_g1_i2:198-3017(+)
MYSADPSTAAAASSACAAAACAAAIGGAHSAVCALLSGVAAAFAAYAGCGQSGQTTRQLSGFRIANREPTEPLAVLETHVSESTSPAMLHRADERSAVRSTPTTPEDRELVKPPPLRYSDRQSTMPAVNPRDMSDLERVAGECEHDCVMTQASSSPSSVLSKNSVRGSSRPVRQEGMLPRSGTTGQVSPRGSARSDAAAAARAAEALAERDSVVALAAIESIWDAPLRHAMMEAHGLLIQSHLRQQSMRHRHRMPAKRPDLASQQQLDTLGEPDSCEHLATLRQVSEIATVISDTRSGADEDTCTRTVMQRRQGQWTGDPLESVSVQPLIQRSLIANRLGISVGTADSSGSSDGEQGRRGIHRRRGQHDGPPSPRRDSSGVRHVLNSVPRESFRRPYRRGESTSSHSPARRQSTGHVLMQPSIGTPFWGTFASSVGQRSDSERRMMGGMGRVCESSEGGDSSSGSGDDTGPDVPAQTRMLSQVSTLRCDSDRNGGVSGTTRPARLLGGGRRRGSSSSSEGDAAMEKVRRERPADVALYRLGLSRVPEWVVADLAATTATLDLASNSITSVPAAIGGMALLTSLNLSSNSIETLPDAVADLPKLHTLHVNHNSLSALPERLGRQQPLVEVNASWNRIEEFPEELLKCGSLRTVNLSENSSIVRLPESWPGPAAGDLCTVRLDNDPALVAAAKDLESRGVKCSFDWNRMFPDLVVPGLYLGSLRSAQDRVYSRLGITHVVTVGRELDVRPPATVQHLKLAVDDVPDEALVEMLADAHRMIGVARGCGGSCFVHCFKGQSRSSTVVITYLMMTERRSFASSLQTVRAARPCVRPNEGFVQQMVRFEEALELERESSRLWHESMTRTHSRVTERGLDTPSPPAKARARRQTWAPQPRGAAQALAPPPGEAARHEQRGHSRRSSHPTSPREAGRAERRGSSGRR